MRSKWNLRSRIGKGIGNFEVGGRTFDAFETVAKEQLT